jgi:hypothetical protein
VSDLQCADRRPKGRPGAAVPASCCCHERSSLARRLRDEVSASKSSRHSLTEERLHTPSHRPIGVAMNVNVVQCMSPLQGVPSSSCSKRGSRLASRCAVISGVGIYDSATRIKPRTGRLGTDGLATAITPRDVSASREWVVIGITS